jgi:hypothetical protein
VRLTVNIMTYVVITVAVEILLRDCGPSVIILMKMCVSYIRFSRHLL